LNGDKIELFEIRIRVPPSSPLIEPDAVGEHLAKSGFGFLQVESAEVRFE